MFEKKGPAADPFPKKPIGSALGGSRASTTASSQPEVKIEAPQAQSVSNLKSVFGFEKKAGDAAPKVGVPPPKTSSDASWIKNKPAEEVKAPIAGGATGGVKPQVPAPAPATNQTNPWKKADPPAQTAPVAQPKTTIEPPKPVELPKPVEQPKPSPF